jgi:peptidoglycan/LPS O-acetylase OafA/YrhL
MRTSERTAATPSGRYEELDSLRAIAALGVICWHYVNGFKAAPFGAVLAPFYGRGLLLVDFFFVLSGFVLAYAFWNERRSPNFGGNVVTRIARIYPLHAAMLCFVAGLQAYLVLGLHAEPFVYTHNDTYHFVLNVLLLNSSGLERGFSFNAPSWSISTEFLVNLLFLALITMPRRLASIGMIVVASIAIGTMISRGLINGTRAFGWIDNDLIRTVAGFFVGVLAQRIHAMVSTRQAPFLWDVAALGLMVGALIYMSLPQAWGNAGDVVVCLVVFPLIILSVIRSGYVSTLLRCRPLVYLGSISYSIYLVHFPIQLALYTFFVAESVHPDFRSRWLFLGFMALVVTIASLTYRYIEVPAKRWITPRRQARRWSWTVAGGMDRDADRPT